MAMAFVYFEKLALRGKLDKENRKLCAGACILLAAKIGSDLKRFEVKQLIDVSIHVTVWADLLLHCEELYCTLLLMFFSSCSGNGFVFLEARGTFEAEQERVVGV